MLLRSAPLKLLYSGVTAARTPGERVRTKRGARYWKVVVDTGLRGVPARFAMPDAV